MQRMNLMVLIDKLEELVLSSGKLPLTSKVLVDEEAFLDLVDKIKAAVPEEIKRAEWLASEKDRVLSESQAKAEQIVKQAEEYVAQLVDEAEIVKKARAESEKILSKARQKARETEQGANEYAETVLLELQASLQKTLQVVQNGLESLRDIS